MGTLFQQFKELSNIIITFFVVTITFGILVYIKTSKFKATEGEIRLYGMFAGMRNIDCIILAFAMIQLITITYAAIIKKVDITLYGMIIAITSIVIILYSFRNVLTEAISLIAQVVAIYFNQMLYQYQIEVESNLAIKSIQIILTMFMILYAIYLFLTHLEIIVKKDKNVRRNKASEKK